MILVGGTSYFYGKLNEFSMVNEHFSFSAKDIRNDEIFFNPYTFPIFKEIYVKNMYLGEGFCILFAGIL